MLKINLLPPYIYEGNKRRNVTIVWIALIAIVIGGMVFAKLQVDAATEARRQETEALRPNADLADRLKAEASSIQARNAVTKGKWTFVTTAMEHTTATYPPLFEDIRNWTIQRVLYRSVIPEGQQVTINAHAPSLREVGHYMLAMEGNNNVTGLNIGINSIPAFGSSGPIRQQGQGGMGGGQQAQGPSLPGGHDFVVTLSLAKPIPAAPVYPAGQGGGQQGGMGGGMGPGGPMGGGMGPGGPMGSPGGGIPPGGGMGPGGGMPAGGGSSAGMGRMGGGGAMAP